MAKHMVAQNVCKMLINNSIPSSTVIMNNNVMTNTFYCIPENNCRNSSNSVMLRNLRIAVTPSYVQGSNMNEAMNTSAFSSALAGDPKRLRHCQDIRSEVLEKWNKNPNVDTQRKWLHDILYNTVVLQ